MLSVPRSTFHWLSITDAAGSVSDSAGSSPFWKRGGDSAVAQPVPDFPKRDVPPEAVNFPKRDSPPEAVNFPKRDVPPEAVNFPKRDNAPDVAKPVAQFWKNDNTPEVAAPVPDFPKRDIAPEVAKQQSWKRSSEPPLPPHNDNH